MGAGDISISSVRHVLSLWKGLLSLGKVDLDGYQFFWSRNCYKIVNEALIVGKKELQDSLYKLIGDNMVIETIVPNE